MAASRRLIGCITITLCHGPHLPKMRDTSKAYIYALITVLFWSTVATAFKIALTYLDVFQLVFYACLTSALVLLFPVLIRWQVRALVKTFLEHWQITVIAGFLNPLFYYIILFAAYDRLPAQVAQPINYTWAIVLTFMSVLFLHQRPTRIDYLSAFICYFGAALIATQGNIGPIEIVEITGLVLAILSTFIWSAYWILNVRDPRDQQFAMCLNFLAALPMAFIVCSVFSSFTVSKEGLFSALYIGVFEMGLAFLFWSRALRLAENTSRVSTLIFLSPFLSLYFISRFLQETIHTTTYFGLVIIITGLLIQKFQGQGSLKPEQPDN